MSVAGHKPPPANRGRLRLLGSVVFSPCSPWGASGTCRPASLPCTPGWPVTQITGPDRLVSPPVATPRSGPYPASVSGIPHTTARYRDAGLRVHEHHPAAATVMEELTDKWGQRAEMRKADDAMSEHAHRMAEMMFHAIVHSAPHDEFLRDRAGREQIDSPLALVPLISSGHETDPGRPAAGRCRAIVSGAALGRAPARRRCRGSPSPPSPDRG